MSAAIRGQATDNGDGRSFQVDLVQELGDGGVQRGEGAVGRGALITGGVGCGMGVGQVHQDQVRAAGLYLQPQPVYQRLGHGSGAGRHRKKTAVEPGAQHVAQGGVGGRGHTLAAAPGGGQEVVGAERPDCLGVHHHAVLLWRRPREHRRPGRPGPGRGPGVKRAIGALLAQVGHRRQACDVGGAQAIGENQYQAGRQRRQWCRARGSRSGLTEGRRVADEAGPTLTFQTQGSVACGEETDQ